MTSGLRTGSMEDRAGCAKSRASSNGKMKAIVDAKMEGQCSEMQDCIQNTRCLPSYHQLEDIYPTEVYQSKESRETQMGKG
ncbi:hypothetical protein Nepgr_003439 [Nepenthes gracilis]|uniref:Uncharacterized protein n=1 Tax=Nepenthes gracilis TaxID=150966 RepID=A0AAD3RZJ7_NEPGR|nr:hypothetical protein Nepgr_003439 [Nepenthes gracilis]